MNKWMMVGCVDLVVVLYYDLNYSRFFTLQFCMGLVSFD